MPGESLKELAETIRQFVLSKYLAGESAANLPDELALQSSGILDSMAALGLISFIEERFQIELDVYDTSIERFDRIADMAVTVARKQAAQAQAASGGQP